MKPLPVRGVVRLALALSGAAGLGAACVSAPPPSAEPAAGADSIRQTSDATASARPDATASDGGGLAADAAVGADASSAASACPDGMLRVTKDFCPKVERQCLKSEYDKANHITLCHRFKPDTTVCRAPRVALDFCIDRYEYPNQERAHPPVMVSFFDASGLCAAKGKRLCYEGEWTAACEGPDEKPFPYGWERSSEKCNFDNAWTDPSLKKIYSDDPAIRDAELARLDRSVPSGSKPGCVSDYGVFDLTGNVDEWTLADQDRPREKGRFSALKGGAWGHVRNACRPVTTSHEPEFTYYFVSFRCCKDVS
ncbi:MAG: SUMF1/EgtB/PvdO family nonheme iron enzyme [Myxococcales bacterium]|nr:SUMF1/EgtB/PvdO family nonheme iron enzyme [Myxococcales bacterium]